MGAYSFILLDMHLHKKHSWFLTMAILTSCARALLNNKPLRRFPSVPRTFVRSSSSSSSMFSSNSRSSKVFLQSSEGTGGNSSGSGNSTMLSASTMATISVAGGAAVLADNEQSDATLCDEGSDSNSNSDIFPEESLKHDTYGGITINVDALESSSLDEHKFVTTLKNSLQQWKQNGRRGIWINIPTKYSSIVPICTEMGFEFQYAKKGLLVMTQWLPENEESRLPHGPTHQVGIGAVILHPITGKMLVVQEKTGPAAKRKLWKMPTGLTDPGEDVVDAAIREAKEEVGLDVEFDRIICMRQAQ